MYRPKIIYKTLWWLIKKQSLSLTVTFSDLWKMKSAWLIRVHNCLIYSCNFKLCCLLVLYFAKIKNLEFSSFLSWFENSSVLQKINGPGSLQLKIWSNYSKLAILKKSIFHNLALNYDFGTLKYLTDKKAAFPIIFSSNICLLARRKHGTFGLKIWKSSWRRAWIWSSFQFRRKVPAFLLK